MNIDNLLLFILAQIFAGISVVLTVISVFEKKQTKLFLIQLIARIFYAFNFVLLGAFVGSIMLCISIVRNLTFFLLARKNKSINYLEVITFESLYVVAGIISFTRIFDLFMILANIIFTLGLAQKNRIIFLSSQIMAGTLATVYNIFCFSFVGIGFEVVSIISGIVAICLIIKRNKNVNLANKYDFS